MISMAFWQASLLQKREQLRLLRLEARRSELSLGPWFLFTVCFPNFCFTWSQKMKNEARPIPMGHATSQTINIAEDALGPLEGWFGTDVFFGGRFFSPEKSTPKRKIRVFQVQVTSGNRQPSLIELYRIHLLVTFLTSSKVIGCSIQKLLWQGLRFKSWKLCWVVMMAWWGTSGWVFWELLDCCGWSNYDVNVF